MRLGKKKLARDNPRRRNTRQDETAVQTTDRSSQYSFRRNRTLTGSSSARIASGNELQAELRSPRANVHHLTSLRQRILLYFAMVCAIAFLLYVLVNQLVATTTISVTGSELLVADDETSYRSAINAYFAARPAERLRFLLNDQELTSHVQASRPEVKHIHIEPGSGVGNAVVQITTRNPIARWSINGQNRYVDSEGVVFKHNYQAPPKLQIIDKSGLENTSSGTVASNQFLGFIGRIVAAARQNHIIVNKVTIPELTTRQVALYTKGDRTYYKLSVDRSVGKQVEDMARIKRYLKKHDIAPHYVDIRIGGKAFYQ